jgi:16S rRNA (cytidine1402-2'-O)-methyltransferase
MLYLVATPIGNLGDITLRALETLKMVDLIACEDKRVSTKLLNHYGISKPLMSYHDHNGEQVRPRLIEALQTGQKIAYITDGGMPLISDPGFKLVLACQEYDLPYTVIPGPSSPLMALCLSGIPPEPFFFCGFLSAKQSARKTALQDLKALRATLIFFESPKRVVAFLKDALDVLGDREGAVCREMTKIYEEVQKNSLSSLIAHYEAHLPRGEVVIVIQGNVAPETMNAEELDVCLKQALETHSLRQAVELVSKSLGLSKREIYQHALHLKSEKTRLS